MIDGYRAFRLDMVAWNLHQARQADDYDLAVIERQLSMTGAAPP